MRARSPGATKSSFYMHIWNRLQRIKSIKMVVETSDKDQFSYFYVLNPFLKLTRPDYDAVWRLISRTVLSEALLSFLIDNIIVDWKCVWTVRVRNMSLHIVSESLLSFYLHWKKSHSLSDRLLSLVIMSEKLWTPLKLLNMIVLGYAGNFRGPSIGPPGYRKTQVSRTAIRLIAVVFPN